MSATRLQFNQVAAAFNSLIGHDNTCDRRASVRWSLQTPLVVRTFDRDVLGEPITLTLQDFSATGMGATYNKPLRIGQELLFQLPQASQPMQVICVVLHCDAIVGGHFRIGAQFNRILNEAPMPELIASAA